MAAVEAEAQAEQVRLVPWAEGDFWLLERTNSPEMTAHLGGPESGEKLVARHRRYVELSSGQMYRVALAEGGETVGSVGFWERVWQDSAIWETGWGILPEFQGRRLAAQAARAVVKEARAAGRRPVSARVPECGAHRVEQRLPPGGLHPAGTGRVRVPEGALDHVERLAVRPGGLRPAATGRFYHRSATAGAGSQRAAAANSPTTRAATGTFTPCRCAARSNAPPMASSSSGRPASESRCIDDFVPGGKAS